MQFSALQHRPPDGDSPNTKYFVKTLTILLLTLLSGSDHAWTFGSGLEPWTGAVDLGRPSFYIGWQTEELGHVAHELHDRGSRVHRLIHGRYQFSQPGLWMGLSDQMFFRDRFRVRLEGWLMIPGKVKALSDYADARWGDPGDVPDTGIGRNWEMKSTQGWFVDATLIAGRSSGGMYDGWSPVAGFRYDFYRRRLQQTSAELIPDAGLNDELDILARTFVPYVGIEYQREGERVSATLRVVGSPIILGTLSHSEDYGPGGFRDEGTFVFDVPRGYWGELFMDISSSPRGRFGVGAFLKMTTMTLQSCSSVASTYASGRSQSAEYDLVYRRMVYTLGAKLSLKFDSPL